MSFILQVSKYSNKMTFSSKIILNIAIIIELQYIIYYGYTLLTIVESTRKPGRIVNNIDLYLFYIDILCPTTSVCALA